MMTGGVAERLRSRDIRGEIKEEEEEEEEEEEGRKMNNYNEEDDDEEEEEEEDDDDDEEEERRNKKVKKWNASTADLEKEKRRKSPINLEEDGKVLDEKAKNKGEKRIHGGNDKAKYRKASTPTIEREKNKKSSSHGREHKMQSGDHDKDKRRNMSLPSDKNKDSLKEKSRKIPTTHSAEKKLHCCDRHKNKTKRMHTDSKYFQKETKKIPSSHNGEHKIRRYCYVEHKGRSEPHPFNNNEMQKNEMKKRKKNNTPLDPSKENKVQTMINNKKESKRKNTTEIFSKGKKMRTKDKDEKAWSGDRWKLKNTMPGYSKEQKVQSGHKEERNVAIAFIKLVYNDNFKEFLLIPPVVTTGLEDLTNRHVNLKDSEGNVSRVRLSMVDGSLAFYEGWNNFVSDHSIKLGDFLLFEYTAGLNFSVRVFGMNSCERVCFRVERQGGKKQKGCHAPDETENAAKSMNAVSGAHGSSIAPYEKDIYLANGKHTANDILQTWTKGTRSSGIILITDDEAPLTQENEDTEKLKTLHAASDTNCMTANTEEGPKGVGSGALCGPSVALDNIEGSLAIGECKTNFLSSSTEKTVRSEIIPVIDTDPLEQKYDDAVELTVFPLHIENTSMVKEPEPEIATAAKCTEIQDSDEDLRRKQEGNTVQLECTTAVGKCPYNSKMNTNGNVFSKYEAPGGSPSLEKWKKDTVSDRTALDVTGLIKPERLMKTEDKLVGNCSSSKYEAPGGSPSLEKWKKAPVSARTALDLTGLIKPEKLLKTEDKLVGNYSSSKYEAPGGSPSLEKWKKATVSGQTALDVTGLIKPERLLKTEDKLVGNYSLNKYEAPGGSPSLEKWKKATVSGRTALDVTGLIKPERLLKTEDKLVGNCSSVGVNSFEQSLQGYAGRAAPDGTVLIRPEKRLKTDDKLVGNCSATGVNPVEQLSRGYAGAHSCVQQTPGKLSKSTRIKTEKLLKTEDKLVGNCSSVGVNSLEQSLQGYAGRAALDVTGLIRPENRLKSDGKLVGNCSATGVNPVEQWSRGYAGTHSCVQQTPGKISKSKHIKTEEIDLLVKEKGPTVQPKTQMEQFEPMGSISCRQQLNNIPVCADHAVARLPEHRSFNQEESEASHHVTPAALLPVKVEVSELDDHSVLKTNLQFCIPSTTQTWLELPSPLSHAHRRKGRRDQNIVMLKDPVRRLWPMFYHEHPLFVGFSRGWKPFVTANNLQTGDVCMLLKDLDEAELVYHVQITRK